MSTLKVTNVWSNTASTPPVIADSAGTTIANFCRAWMNLDGTGAMSVRGSFNVSSVVKDATGQYAVTFTNAMPDANFSSTTSVKCEDNTTIGSNNNSTHHGTAVRTASSVKVFSSSSASARIDSAVVNLAVFR